MLSALLLAVRNQLRTSLTLDASGCGIQLDAQPPPFFGQQYISIYGTSWKPTSEVMEGIDENFSLSIALTKRFPYAPKDRVADELYINLVGGMELLIRQINGIVHRSNPIQIATNVIVTAQFSSASKFIEPLVWKGSDSNPTIMNGAWCGSDDEKLMNDPAALLMQTYFGDARRVQSLATYDED